MTRATAPHRLMSRGQNRTTQGAWGTDVIGRLEEELVRKKRRDSCFCWIQVSSSKAGHQSAKPCVVSLFFAASLLSCASRGLSECECRNIIPKPTAAESKEREASYRIIPEQPLKSSAVPVYCFRSGSWEMQPRTRCFLHQGFRV